MDPTGDRDLRTGRLELQPLAPIDTEPLHAVWTAPGVRALSVGGHPPGPHACGRGGEHPPVRNPGEHRRA